MAWIYLVCCWGRATHMCFNPLFVSLFVLLIRILFRLFDLYFQFIHRRSQIGFDSFESAKRPFCGSWCYRHSQKNLYSSVDVRIQLGFSMLECVNKCARLLSNGLSLMHCPSRDSPELWPGYKHLCSRWKQENPADVSVLSTYYIDITIQLSWDCMEHEKTIKREE
jgi:hypothetical protein